MITRRSRRESARIRTSRRIRALLAAGVVLGIGAASTLAAWTDQENASATLTAGTFGIVGAAGTDAFAEHPASGPARLSFSVPTGGLMPGATVYAKFTVKTTAQSAAGSVSLTAGAGTDGGLAQYLRYGVRQIAAGATCEKTSYDAGAVVVPHDSALATPTTPTTPAQSLGAAGANPVAYCFAVTLVASAPNDAQGKTASPAWIFTGQNA